MHAQDHDPGDILSALRMGVDYTFTIRVRNLEIVVRPLSIAEHVKIVNDVTADVSKMAPTQQNSLTESALLAMRMLELATTPEPGSAIAPRLPAHVMNRMTNDELIALHRAYIAGCDALDPSLERMSVEQLDALVAEAKKNDSALIGLSPSRLVQLARFLLTRPA